MIARAADYRPPSARLRRFLAALGSRTIASTRLLLLFVSLAATVLIVTARRSTWHGPIRTEFMRVLHGVAVRSLPTTVATGMLVGFALVTQAVYWLEQTGTTGLVGPVIVVLLIRELVPILIELGEAQTKGWLRVLEIQGLDPLVLLVLPRALGFAIGAFCLATVLLLTTLVTGYLVAHALALVAYSVWDFADLVLRAMKVQDFIFPPLKCITIGFVVALACCATGLGRRDESDELQRLVPRGFVRSALAILVVNSLFDLVG
jgi:phospholipid/cholesterol/gamma-HCH transport system permease protein